MAQVSQSRKPSAKVTPARAKTFSLWDRTLVVSTADILLTDVFNTTSVHWHLDQSTTSSRLPTRTGNSLAQTPTSSHLKCYRYYKQASSSVNRNRWTDDGISCHVSFLVGWKWSRDSLDVDEPSLALCAPLHFKWKQQTKWSLTLLGHRFYTTPRLYRQLSWGTLTLYCSVITTLVYNETNIHFLSWRYYPS